MNQGPSQVKSGSAQRTRRPKTRPHTEAESTSSDNACSGGAPSSSGDRETLSVGTPAYPRHLRTESKATPLNRRSDRSITGAQVMQAQLAREALRCCVRNLRAVEQRPF